MHRGMVTRISGAFAKYCGFVMQKFFYENSKLKHNLWFKMSLVLLGRSDNPRVFMHMCGATISHKS